MQVREIMTVEVVTAEPDSTLQEIAAIMRDEDTGAVPIVDDGGLVGVITDRDIVIRCIAEGRDVSEVTANDILTDDLETIEPDADVEEASCLMSRKQIRRLPVVENDKLVGIVSLGDLAVKSDEDEAGDTLEEVSRGVKGSSLGGKKHGKQQKGSRESGGRSMGVSASRRVDQERGAIRPVSDGRDAKQGIANRSAGEEESRQGKVVPMRNQGKTARKRRAS